MRPLVVLAAVAVLATGCGAAPEPAPTEPSRKPRLLSVIRIAGEVVVTDPATIRYRPGYRTCVARGAASDIRRGAVVTVKNDDDVLIGVGHLYDGRMRTTSPTKPLGCVFGFEIKDSPGGRPAYDVAVAGRAPQRVAAEDLTRVELLVPRPKDRGASPSP